MLIDLIDIESERQMQRALARPIGKEDHALYVTHVAMFARQLADAKLPCIFCENDDGKGQHIYGADMIICEADAEQPDAWRQEEGLLLNLWKRHYGIPWTIAETERLLIRESTMADLPQFLSMYAKERENKDVHPLKRPEEELESYIKNRYPFFGYGLWSVVERDSGGVIGRMGFEEMELPDGNGADGNDVDGNDADEREWQIVPELSYLIAEAYRGKGYAAEAARAILQYAKETLEFSRVCIRTSRENRASRRLADSLGFYREEDLEKFFSNGLDSPIIYVYDL